MATGAAESRRHPRAQARVRVEYHYGSVTGVGYSCNLSESGVFIECNNAAPPGQRIYMRFFLPQEPSYALKIIGIVKRSAGKDSPRPGMGVQFEVAYARTREALLEFIEETLVYGQAALPADDDEYHPEQTNLSAMRLSMTADEINQSVDFDADAGPLPAASRLALVLLALVALGGLAYAFRVAAAGPL